MQRSGLTLVEVVIGALVLSVVIAGLWALSTFSGRSTHASAQQAQYAEACNVLFRRLQRELDRTERVLYPPPGQSTAVLVSRHRSGSTRLTYLAPGQGALVTRSADGDQAAVAGELGGVGLYFTGVLFSNVAGRELQVLVSFCDRTGEDLPSLSQVVASFPLRR